METKPEISIKKYGDIASEYEIINAWREYGQFPYKNASEEDRLYLKELNVIELILSKENNAKVSSDVLFECYDQLVKELITALPNPSFIGVSDFKLQKVSKLRSYKGILTQKVREYGIQNEVFFPNDYSIIAGLIKVTSENFDLTLPYFTEGGSIFMINTSRDVFTKAYIEEVVRKCIVHSNTSIINFIALLSFFNCSEDLLFRMGGDGGNRYVSLQIFCHKPKTNFILSKLKKYL